MVIFYNGRLIRYLKSEEYVYEWILRNFIGCIHWINRSNRKGYLLNTTFCVNTSSYVRLHIYFYMSIITLCSFFKKTCSKDKLATNKIVYLGEVIKNPEKEIGKEIGF